jgi:AcrR family transcriptional regulator
MPRKPDPLLEERILEAARKLWIKGGDEALSLRAVARAARTNTPAIYRRFRTRNDILRTLMRLVQRDLRELLEGCNSLEEAGQTIFAFAMAHHREYELMTSGLFHRLKEPQPLFEFMKQRSAEWLGGSPDDHSRLLAALHATIHGTIMLLIRKTAPKDAEAELPSVLADTIKVLIRNRSALAPSPRAARPGQQNPR